MLLFLLYFRFLGTTPKSSTILRVLKSIMLQIKHVYKFSAKIPRVSERFYNKLLPVIRKDFMLINENLRLKLILVYLLWVSKSVTLYILLTIFTIIITINMIIGIIQLNHIIFDAPHVKFCVCHVSMLPQRNLYRHTFEDTRVHKIIQKRFSLFFIDWFFFSHQRASFNSSQNFCPMLQKSNHWWLCLTHWTNFLLYMVHGN